MKPGFSRRSCCFCFLGGATHGTGADIPCPALENFQYGEEFEPIINFQTLRCRSPTRRTSTCRYFLIVPLGTVAVKPGDSRRYCYLVLNGRASHGKGADIICRVRRNFCAKKDTNGRSILSIWRSRARLGLGLA